MEKIVYGKNPVKEALKSGRNIREILFSKNGSGFKEIIDLAKNRRVLFKFVETKTIAKYSKNTQGVVAFVCDVKFYDVFEVLAYLKKEGKSPFFLICDGVKDPHNLGALIRTSYAVGVDLLIIPKRRSAPINSTVEKVSAGAVSFLKIAVVSNIVEIIKKLQNEGVFVYCADSKGKDIYKTNFKGAIGLVVGSEGKGASSLVKKTCDGLCRIPMQNKIDSLNVSVAGAIVMYEILRQNKEF